MPGFFYLNQPSAPLRASRRDELPPVAWHAPEDHIDDGRRMRHGLFELIEQQLVPGIGHHKIHQKGGIGRFRHFSTRLCTIHEPGRKCLALGLVGDQHLGRLRIGLGFGHQGPIDRSAQIAFPEAEQVIAEFADPATPVRSRTPKGEEEKYALADLLPHAFTKDFL